jgi:hypothetical protein
MGACQQAADPQALADLDALLQCINTNCAADPNATCIDANCAAEQAQCLGGGGGGGDGGTCMGIVQCQNQCTQENAQTCVPACVAAGSAAAQAAFDALYNCIFEACPTPGDMACQQAAQGPGGACEAAVNACATN